MWQVHLGQRPPLIIGCPKPIENLMTSCWDPSPEKRPSMKDVVEEMQILCEFFPNVEPLNLDLLDDVSFFQERKKKFFFI